MNPSLTAAERVLLPATIFVVGAAGLGAEIAAARLPAPLLEYANE